MSERPTLEQELEMISDSIKARKQNVALGEALIRLFKNRDFKLVILEHFMKEEAVRTVKLMAAPECQNPAIQESMQKTLIAIGQLDQFMRITLQLADQAKMGIADDETEYESILAEINSVDNK